MTMQHLLITGQAGTGKTHEALAYALERYAHTGKKIVIIRNIVQVRDIGYLPGSVDEKIQPFFDIYEPIMQKIQPDINLKSLLHHGEIVFDTTSFLRGRTFDDAIVILDEAQNLTLHELKTVLTRIGEYSQFVVVGDTGQRDVSDRESGFDSFCSVFRTLKDVEEEVLTKNWRSPLVQDYLDAENKIPEDLAFLNRTN